MAKAVDGVSFEIAPGKTMALVGESGCGKSVTALSILRLIPDPPGKIVSGEICLDGTATLEASEATMRTLRGNAVSMIFQEPMTCLNPVFRVGAQISAVLELHEGLDKLKARERAIELLDKVGIPLPEDRVDDFPHQMSGGMRQRVMIAMALACSPSLLIADEPTTALDVTIQAQILELLRQLQKESGMAILLITHNLGVIAEMADDVAIMYAGKIVEQAAVHDLYDEPLHPYTAGLFGSVPSLKSRRGRLYSIRGQVPAASDFPDGCRFHPRCPYVMEICRSSEPKLLTVGQQRGVACWLHDPEAVAREGRPLGLPAREVNAS